MDPERLVDLVSSVRSSIEAEFLDADITLPARSYFQHGTISVDCPATLAIGVLRIYQGQPTGETLDLARCVLPRTAEVDIQLWRCVPTPDGRYMPTPAELETSAIELFTDGWVLSEALIRAARTLAETQEAVGLGAVVPLGPQGGAAGWQASLRVGVEARP